MLALPLMWLAVHGLLTHQSPSWQTLRGLAPAGTPRSSHRPSLHPVVVPAAGRAGTGAASDAASEESSEALVAYPCPCPCPSAACQTYPSLALAFPSGPSGPFGPWDWVPWDWAWTAFGGWHPVHPAASHRQASPSRWQRQPVGVGHQQVPLAWKLMPVSSAQSSRCTCRGTAADAVADVAGVAAYGPSGSTRRRRRGLYGHVRSCRAGRGRTVHAPAPYRAPTL